jgi:23S rRNA pseudouridine1911/1915/1917 synthase
MRLLWNAITLFGFLFPCIKHNLFPFCRQSAVSYFSTEECDSILRLDSFLSQKCPQFSRSRIGAMCERGLVKVNDKIRSKAFKVSKGDNISVVFEDLPLPNVNPENISLDVVYEDAYLLAVNKANGMVVHPSAGTPNGTFVNALLHYYLQKNVSYSDLVGANNPSVGNNYHEEDDESIMGATEIPLSLRPGIVHRLDKGTTGVLLAGKSFEAVEKLSLLFADRKIYKYYLAICIGHPGNKTISQPIGRSRKNRQLMCGVAEPEGKMAVTHTRTLAFNGKLSLVLVKIDTGR